MNRERFVWTKDRGVGVKMIDEQHQAFFEIANEIIDLTAKKKLTKDEVMFALTKLGDHALYHFESEENFMKKSKFPLSSEHMVEHAEYKKQIRDFFQHIRVSEKNPKALAEEVADFSSDWVSRHMLGSESKWAEFLREQGVK